MSYKAAVITVSDRCAAHTQKDTSGPAVAKMLEDIGFEVIYTSTVPDERHMISAEFIKCEYELEANLIVSTGGTGFSHRDVTPEATLDVIDREVPAIPQAMLHYSLQITPRAMLSRAVAGIRNDALIVNLPGSEKAAKENLTAIAGALEHAMHMLAGEGHGK